MKLHSVSMYEVEIEFPNKMKNNFEFAQCELRMYSCIERMNMKIQF